jgi:hypothetical protein
MTTMADELAYLIQEDHEPSSLKTLKETCGLKVNKFLHPQVTVFQTFKIIELQICKVACC